MKLIFKQLLTLFLIIFICSNKAFSQNDYQKPKLDHQDFLVARHDSRCTELCQMEQEPTYLRLDDGMD